MDWSNPELLYFLLPACLGWVAMVVYSDRCRRQAAARFVDSKMSDRLMPQPSPLRFWAKLILQCLGISSGLVALAGPRFGDQVEEIVPRGSDLYVLVDVSRSMLADDVIPSRLARAKSDIAALVNRLQGERIGLIAFAGQAVVKCPLTVDYSSFRRSLDELDPNSAPRGGTAIGDAIRKALEVFQSNSERDQAILLITDGDDQQSYPKEAATLAAERTVTIFCVGLGDSAQGARIPQKDKTGVYMEHQGEQVWSKLDGSLLQEIALTTSGVYIPAGTKSYDLAELYTQYLQGKRGDKTTSQTRIRKAEQFQIFLAIACFAWLIDLLIVPYRGLASMFGKVAVAIAILLGNVTQGVAVADESTAQIRKGVQLYANQNFDEAQKAFAAASNSLKEDKTPRRFVAFFDEACALHRKGDFVQAKEKYLQAGLSQDRDLAVAAHFNLGMLASDRARSEAGDQPDKATDEKRALILNALQEAVASYRHCLDLNPQHTPSRKNLEIVRQWIKYYKDKWNENDRQRRRDETNLIQFVEFLVQSEESLRESIRQSSSLTSRDTFAEWKRLQDELYDEIPVLKEKITTELQPPAPSDANASSPVASTSSAAEEQQRQQAIQLLHRWADDSGMHMSNASLDIGRSNAADAQMHLQKAIDELNRIWEALIPFHPLLERELFDQSAIVESLGVSKPDESSSNQASASIPSDKPDEEPDSQSEVVADSVNWPEVSKQQTRILARTRLLAPKAESELQQLESQPAPSTPMTNDSPASNANQVDPELVKKGYRTAIELAPQAVQTMENALDGMKSKEKIRAIQHAQEAERILKEIKAAQPKQQQPQDKNQSSDKQDNQEQENQDQKNQPEKKDESKGDQQKGTDEQKKDPPKGDEENEGDKENSNPNQTNSQKQASVSRDRIEEALRKVREREQEKRDRDREMRARILGRSPVDKDW